MASQQGGDASGGFGGTAASGSGAGMGGSGAEPSARTSIRERAHYLQRQPLGISSVPYHASFGSSSSSSKEREGHPTLGAFLKGVVDEARSWDIGSQADGWRETGTHVFGKKSRAAGVRVGQYVAERNGDMWFARVSRHKHEGDTRWQVLDRVLRVEHSKHEGEYTPNVFDVDTVVRWDVHGDEEVEVGLQDVRVEITNMYHGIPAPLNDRVFSVLLVSGVLAKTAEGGREESLVLQIPVDLASFPEVVKRKCHHRFGENGSLSYHPPEDAITSQNEAKVGKSLVQGEYASVEKVVRVGEESQWVMATASNAKGVLPMWVQKKAVPGEIVKDVEYVYGFIEKHRSELVGESGV